LRHYTPDSCVASTAIGKLVLDHLDIPAEPVSLKALLVNHAWIKRAEREGKIPDSTEERERWFIESGAHAIGVGIYDPDSDVPAIVNGLHVGLLVDNAWLWDLSIDQANRPQYGIVIKEPFLGGYGHSPRRQRWLQGKDAMTWEAPGQGVIVYTTKPGDKRYLEHPNWRADGNDVATRMAIAAEVILTMRALYENPN
jgi:hypothetical protein